jgi:hypothetical protein
MKPHRTSLSFILLIIITNILLITSCTHKADLTGLPQVCFERDVLPVFTNNCAISGCHDGRGRGSARALDNYNSILNLVTPGNPNSSSVYQVIIAKWGENQMPPNQPLSLENRTIIRVWIEQGALQTVCSITKATDGGLLSEKQNSLLK